MKLNGLFAKFTGSAGGLTFAVVNGQQIGKSKVISNKSQSVKQIFQRARFAYVLEQALALKISVVDYFWDQFKDTRSAINIYLGYSVERQTEYAAPETPFVPDWTKLKMSKGSLEGIEPVSTNIYVTATGLLTVAWNSDILGNGLATDKIFVVIIDTENGVYIINDTATRTDSSIDDFDIGEGRDATKIYTYVFAYRELTNSILMSGTVGTVCTAA